MGDPMSRRTMIKSVGLGALAMAAGGQVAASQEAHGADMASIATPVPYELPPLPYPYNALSPAIDEKIVRIHHDMHHAGYVKGLNTTLEALALARAAGDMSAIRSLSRDLAFFGSGHLLHSLYWQSMSPGDSTGPEGRLLDAIEGGFGSFGAFRQQFLAAAKEVEASGWGLLVYEPAGARLLILQAERHEDLTIWGVRPLLACDVWEHAYYLQYENRRGAYVDGFFGLIDWPSAQTRFDMLAP